MREAAGSSHWHSWVEDLVKSLAKSSVKLLKIVIAVEEGLTVVVLLVGVDRAVAVPCIGSD